MIYQTPVLDHVNLTNSSMHAIQIIAPRNKVVMNDAMNVSHNNGVGINVLSLNLEGSTSSTGTPIRNLSFPYHLFGLMDMCSVGKTVRIESRVLLYYKYDSYPVDCIKYFTTNSNRDVWFRILQANLYNPHDPSGRPDAIRFYKSYTMTEDHLIGEAALWGF